PASACGGPDGLHLSRGRHLRLRGVCVPAGRAVHPGEVLMTQNGWFQLIFYVAVLIALAKPLGSYMARVYEGQPAFLNRVGAPFARVLVRLFGTDPARDMTWVEYAIAMLVFNLLGVLVVYAIQRLQAFLPLNPASMPGVSPDSSFNTATSFATNTNWQ